MCAALTALCIFLLMTGFAMSQERKDEEQRLLDVVTSVIDGDTLVLASGKEVRLTGIQAPKLPLNRPGFQTQPLAEDAKRSLEQMALGKSVTLDVGGAGRDRYGRWLAQVHLEDGPWLQAEMITLGLARVYSFADNRAPAPHLLALEQDAREARVGIWELPYYAIRKPNPALLRKELGSFQLVEGRVKAAARVRGRTFLNFGDNYKTDFTVTIAPRDLSRFTAAGQDPRKLEGKRIRVRGWLTSFNGPSMELDHPEQIEVLEP